jgi:flavin-dependent dehydrogenase
LNGAALAALDGCGLGSLPARLGAVPLSLFKLCAIGARAALDFSLGVSISREAFDTALAEEAVRAGACFAPRTCALIGTAGSRRIEVSLRHASETRRVQARLVLAADGLSGRSLAAHPELRAQPACRSRIGAGAVLAGGPACYAAGTVFMACGRGGYVGLVRLEDRRLNVAAAFDLAAVRAAGGPAQLAAQILAQVGLPAPGLLAEALWHATPALTTSRAHVAAERVFVLGDAAGYVEPFTGEGMAWAVRSAAAVAPLALSAVGGWRPELAGEWESALRQIVGHRQRVCRTLSGLLRSPALASLGAGILSRAPWLAAPLVRSLNAGDQIGPCHAAPCSPLPQGPVPQPAIPVGHAFPTSHHA